MARRRGRISLARDGRLQLYPLIEGANVRMPAEGDLTAIAAVTQAAQNLLANIPGPRHRMQRSRRIRK